MKSLSNFFQLFSLLLLCGVSVLAQATNAPAAKQFTKDGLTLNYPAGWSFNDNSNSDSQDLTFGRADSDAQIKVFVFRPLITTPEKLAEAKRVLVDKYVAATTKSFADAGAKPESSPAETENRRAESRGSKGSRNARG